MSDYRDDDWDQRQADLGDAFVLLDVNLLWPVEGDDEAN